MGEHIGLWATWNSGRTTYEYARRLEILGHGMNFVANLVDSRIVQVAP